MDITLEQASFIAEIIGGIVVIVSLIYVGLGVRQNVQAVRLSTSQVVTKDLREAVNRWIDSDIADIMLRGMQNDDLQGAEQLQFYSVLLNLMRVMENGYLQMNAGALDPGVWEGFKRNYADAMSTPGAKVWWAARKNWFNPDFQRYFDEQILEHANPDYRFAGT